MVWANNFQQFGVQGLAGAETTVTGFGGSDAKAHAYLKSFGCILSIGWGFKAGEVHALGLPALRFGAAAVGSSSALRFATLAAASSLSCWAHASCVAKSGGFSSGGAQIQRQEAEAQPGPCLED